MVFISPIQFRSKQNFRCALIFLKFPWKVKGCMCSWCMSVWEQRGDAWDVATSLLWVLIHVFCTVKHFHRIWDVWNPVSHREGTKCQDWDLSSIRGKYKDESFWGAELENTQAQWYLREGLLRKVGTCPGGQEKVFIQLQYLVKEFPRDSWYIWSVLLHCEG